MAYSQPLQLDAAGGGIQLVGARCPGLPRGEPRFARGQRGCPVRPDGRLAQTLLARSRGGSPGGSPVGGPGHRALRRPPASPRRSAGRPCGPVFAFLLVQMLAVTAYLQAHDPSRSGRGPLGWYALSLLFLAAAVLFKAVAVAAGCFWSSLTSIRSGASARAWARSVGRRPDKPCLARKTTLRRARPPVFMAVTISSKPTFPMRLARAWRRPYTRSGSTWPRRCLPVRLSTVYGPTPGMDVWQRSAFGCAWAWSSSRSPCSFCATTGRAWPRPWASYLVILAPNCGYLHHQLADRGRPLQLPRLDGPRRFARGDDLPLGVRRPERKPSAGPGVAAGVRVGRSGDGPRPGGPELVPDGDVARLGNALGSRRGEWRGRFARGPDQSRRGLLQAGPA